MGHYDDYYEQEAREAFERRRKERDEKGPKYLKNIDDIFKVDKNGYGSVPTQQIRDKIDELKGLVLLWMKD